MRTLPRLELRRPSPDRYAVEAAEVADLFLAARRAALPGLRQVHSADEAKAWIRNELFPRRSIFLAVFASEIVGFAARDGAWLEQLYVKPGWTGHGIGQRLLDAVIAEAAAVTPVLRLHTFQRNEGARRFYERNGFVVVALGDGSGNEEREPDARYERSLR
jgi:GNAT superfamily N-acetyltransferase